MWKELMTMPHVIFGVFGILFANVAQPLGFFFGLPHHQSHIERGLLFFARNAARPDLVLAHHLPARQHVRPGKILVENQVPDFPVLVGLHRFRGNTRGLDGVQTEQQLLTDGVLRVEEAVGKLGVVLKQGVLPRGAVTLAVLAIGQDGCAAADGGGAAHASAQVAAAARGRGEEERGEKQRRRARVAR